MTPSAYTTAAEARTRSEILADAYPSGDGDVALDSLLLAESIIVGSLTCRSMVEGQPGTSVPEYLGEVATRAVVLKAEQGYQRAGTSASRRKALRNANLQSITAGPWSESYFGPEKAADAKMLDPDPATAEALWALATPECREAWLALWTGEHAPAAGVLSFEYRNRPGGTGGWVGPLGDWLPGPGC